MFIVVVQFYAIRDNNSVNLEGWYKKMTERQTNTTDPEKTKTLKYQKKLNTNIFS